MGTGAQVARAAATALLLGALAGCALAPQPVVTRLPDDAATTSTPPASSGPSPTDQRSPKPTQTDPAGAAGMLECAGAPSTVTAGSGVTTVVGDCPALRIEGSDVAVDATGASVGELSTRGDRITVGAAAVGSVTVEGNHVTIAVDSISSLVVRGDGNAVAATGAISAVVVSGNDNVLSADSVGSADVQGSGNSVG